jgi:proline dehydrogenase
MTSPHKPTFPMAWQPLVEDAANALRALALNEDAKARIANDPSLMSIVRKIAHRYIGGETLAEALITLARVAKVRPATIDYMGESCRDQAFANSETEVFLALIEEIRTRAIPSSISLDLSHIGSVISADLGYENASKIASACRDMGTEMIISMEGSDRTDLILSTHARLCKTFSNVGITIQARLLRTERDIEVLLDRPGKIRLVKGAYLEPESVAYPRNSPQLASAYRQYAKRLIQSGHSCSIATHDRDILNELHEFIESQDLRKKPYEFEMLLGLWDDQLNVMSSRGHATREYVVYGAEWFLYVCNRIAEEPIRAYQALVDAVTAKANG